MNFKQSSSTMHSSKIAPVADWRVDGGAWVTAGTFCRLSQ